MYKISKKLMISGIASLLATTLYSGEVTIPNTFTANTKAKAAEVNANFTAVKDVVNANAKLLSGVTIVNLVESEELTGNINVIGSGYTDQLSITINAPADGIVQVLATGTIQILGKTNASDIRVFVGLTSISNDAPETTDNTTFYRSAADGTGNYAIPYSIQSLFQVTKGTQTFYLVAKGGGATSEKLFWNNLIATFHANNIGN